MRKPNKVWIVERLQTTAPWWTDVTYTLALQVHKNQLYIRRLDASYSTLTGALKRIQKEKSGLDKLLAGDVLYRVRNTRTGQVIFP